MLRNAIAKTEQNVRLRLASVNVHPVGKDSNAIGRAVTTPSAIIVIVNACVKTALPVIQ